MPLRYLVDRIKWLVNEYKYMSQLINHPVNAINPEFGRHKPMVFRCSNIHGIH